MPRKRSIGAVVILDDPDGERKAVLQVRDQGDSFPGCAQLTVHGRVEDGESLKEALRRESHEEIEELFRRANQPSSPAILELAHVPPEPLHVEGRATTPKEQVVSLSLTVRDPSFLSLIQPLIDSGVIRLVSTNDLPNIVTINPKNPDQKQHGIGEGLIGMFADERQVVERVLSSTAKP